MPTEDNAQLNMIMRYIYVYTRIPLIQNIRPASSDFIEPFYFRVYIWSNGDIFTPLIRSFGLES